MQLKEVMTSRVTVIAPEATIQAAAEKMSDLDIGLLPVCEGGRLVGVVTDRDITVRAVAEGRGPVTTQVREGDDPRCYLRVRRPGWRGCSPSDGAVPDSA